MDDKIVDFSKLKEKVRDKDINDFENYIYNLYFKMAEGKMNMMQFTKEITSYMQENNISEEKFVNIQKEMLSRYGVSMDDIDGQLKGMGIDPATMTGMNSKAYEDMRKVMGFQEKYKTRLSSKTLTTYRIKNEKNDIEIHLEGNNVLIKSSKDIDLQDIELNEFLCSYKKTLEDSSLSIELCSNIQTYIY